MSELSRAPVDTLPLAQKERLSVIFAYIGTIIAHKYITSEGMIDETLTSVEFVNSRMHFANGRPITFADRQEVAAMHTMQQLPDLFVLNTPVVIDRLVNGAEAVYSSTEQQLKAIGLPTAEKYNYQVFKYSLGILNGKQQPEDSPLGQTIREVWDKRGSVTEQYFLAEDLMKALEEPTSTDAPVDMGISADNILYEGYKLPETPEFPVTLPYYFKYVTETNGALKMLTAYLEDIRTLDERLR